MKTQQVLLLCVPFLSFVSSSTCAPGRTANANGYCVRDDPPVAPWVWIAGSSDQNTDVASSNTSLGTSYQPGVVQSFDRSKGFVLGGLIRDTDPLSTEYYIPALWQADSSFNLNKLDECTTYDWGTKGVPVSSNCPLPRQGGNLWSARDSIYVFGGRSFNGSCSWGCSRVYAL
jgi:hypothetical protein